MKSKSKKQFQHGVRIGFSATIIPEVTMPRALSLVFSSSAEPVLQAVWSLSPLFGVHPPAPVKQLLLSSRHLFTGSPCPQLHCNLAPLPFCPSLSLSLSLLVQSLHRRVLVLLSLRATLPCCPMSILFGLITTHHHFGSSRAVAFSFCCMPGKFPGPPYSEGLLPCLFWVPRAHQSPPNMALTPGHSSLYVIVSPSPQKLFS